MVWICLLLLQTPDGMQGLADTHTFQHSWNDTKYFVHVRLPPQLEKGRKYPTVYLLDGGITYPLLASFSHYLQLGEEIPPVILVGLSYGSDRYEDGNVRSRDYTAPSTERENWGGASNFADMLERELIPLIERRFPSDSKKRIIFGNSLGGQFVLYCALFRSDLFWGHIASNPALHRNLPFFMATETPEGDPMRGYLYVSSAANDQPRFREPAVAWMAHISNQRQLPFRLKTETLDGDTHFSAVPESFRHGMTWLLQQD